MDPRKKRKILIAVAILVGLGAIVGFTAWYKLFRDVPQPEWITQDQRENFLYGSIGAEGNAGMPYWIWLVLPRMFPEYLPGPGGYASLGVSWEEGKEMPAGFSKKTVGFVRVGENCAICHSASYRTREDEVSKVVAAGPGNTADIQGLIAFFTRCASDPRFNAGDLLAEIDQVTKLSVLDRLIYRLAIPRVRQALLDQGHGFDWAKKRPDWGPGRDAPMNLTKFSLLHLPEDGTIDNTDFPAIWHLAAREQAGRTWTEKTPDPVPPHTMLMNLDGATTSFRSVLIDSALGLQATNTPFFHRRIPALLDWLRQVRPPPYPFPVDAQKVALGKPIFEAQCASCHAPDRDNRLGTVIPIAEIGTDRMRLDAWTQAAADGANRQVASLGIVRTPMIKTQGFIAVQLDGLWLRGPFLHNGSVPTVRDLLTAPAARPQTFYRGYDLLDGQNLGFVSNVAQVHGHKFFPFDTRTPGNGNGGHDYGTALSATEKDALLEYLKTL
jgi:mono/diheme cytochrome c family protein